MYAVARSGSLVLNWNFDVRLAFSQAHRTTLWLELLVVTFLQPRDVFRCGALNVVLRPIPGVLAQSRDVEVGVAAWSGWVAAFGKLDPGVGKNSFDRGGKLPVIGRASRADVVGGVIHGCGGLEQRDRAGAVLDVAEVDAVLGVRGALGWSEVGLLASYGTRASAGAAMNRDCLRPSGPQTPDSRGFTTSKPRRSPTSVESNSAVFFAPATGLPAAVIGNG